MRRALVMPLVLTVALASVSCAATSPSGPHYATAGESVDQEAVNYPTNWWADVSLQPDTWYISEDGRRIAENIMSWQDESGGWPLMNTTNEPFTGDDSRAGPWGTRGALIKATVNEIRFLARGYRVTSDERYHESLMRGLEFIYEAQYPTGGWPHSYPLTASSPAYHWHATFNDDMMPDLMTLLREAATVTDFDFLGDAGKARARGAFERGVDFVLQSQIDVGGVPTAWGQQHDPTTYEPRAGRSFEPAAISGAESASVLHMLMDIPAPSPEVIAAVEAGVAWYGRSQIDGLELIQTAEDRVVIPNPDAPPLWARFYEIDTNRPIFAGRDGIIRYSMAEIEQERRAGYAWYNRSGTGVLSRHASWRTALP